MGEKRTLPNNILRRKANCIGHILRRNCLLHDAIEGQITEEKGEGRRTQLLDDLRNTGRYWELKEEAEDRKRWKRQFISIERKEEIQVISIYLLIRSYLIIMTIPTII